MNDYFYYGIGLAAVIFSQLKYYLDLKANKALTLGQRLIHLGYGTTGSVITLVLVYELGMYTGFPEKVSFIVGAGMSYLGGETMKNLLIRVVEKKIDKI